MNKKQLLLACSVLFLSSAAYATTQLDELFPVINRYIWGELADGFCYARMQAILLAGHDNRADCCAIARHVEVIAQEELLDVVHLDDVAKSIQRALHVLDATNRLVRACSDMEVHATKFDVIEKVREKITKSYQKSHRLLLQRLQKTPRRRGMCVAIIERVVLAAKSALTRSGGL